MSPEQRNSGTLKEAYRLWHDSKGQSIEHWISIMAERVSFGSQGQGRDPNGFTQHRAGRDEVRAYMTELTKHWEMVDYVVHHFVADGDRVVVLGRTAWRNKRTGKKVDTPKADAWRFDHDGKAVEFFEYYDTAALFEAAS